MKPGKKGIARIIDATGYSFKGFKAVWNNEAAFRQEIAIIIPLVILSFFLPINNLEQILLIGSLVIVILTELINSSIEAIVDRIGAGFNELSGRAKDIGSAAVLVAISLAVFTWLMVLV